MFNQKCLDLEDKQIFILSIFFLQNSFLLINYYVKQKEHKVLMIAIINNNLSLVKNWYIGKEIFFFYEIKNNNVLIRKDKDFCILNINQKYEIKFEILFSIKLDYFDVILSKDNDIVIYNDFSIEIYLYTEKSTNYYQNMNKERKKRTDIYIHSLFVINSSYNSNFMLNERLIATTQNKYGCYVNVPNITIYDIGWDPDGYYISDIVPVESWYQKSHTMQFNIIMDEYYCWASFGSADYNNAVAQLDLIEQQGYYFCSINDWNGLDCFEKYNNLLDLYYNAWNFLPTYGYGWSRYRQLVCDSGYTEEARR